MTEPPSTLVDALQERYVLERELGRGGMATVYLAVDLKLHRPVALKVLRPELAATLGTERFLREIEIAARLSHPHILQLHDSGEAGGRLYYAMPYVEGESLRQRLERLGQLPLNEVIAIVRAVASALTYAHKHGVVHRDIKPENILLAKDSQGNMAHPLVADFGIARALDVAGGERLTETGLALGTPAYMSPEQSASDRRLDGRSDIYALGCVAYEMLAGSPPFTGPSAQAVMARHAVDAPPPLHTVRTTVPRAVELAIERALCKVPADRFNTATEFAEALLAEPPLDIPNRRRLTGKSRQLLLGMAAISAAGAGVLVSRDAAAPAVVSSASRMAVLPFLSPGGDTALARLGKDLATTISASLEGVGGIETADRLSIATGTADRTDLSAGEGAALARRLGASSVVRGTLVRAGDRVRLDLGLYGTEGLAPLAQGITASAHRDSIGTLTDSATWGLLRQVWQKGDPPSPSLAAITTHSLPALRAFLQGERELGANRWEEAALAFRSAIAADSTFWLAHFRYALARWWKMETPEPEILTALGRHREILPERERLLAETFLDSTASGGERIERFRLVTQRFPAYWPGWFLYADALYHFGPESGHEWTEGLQAFRRVVALNPRLVPAWEHMFKLSLGRAPAEAGRSYAQLIELGWLEQLGPWDRLFIRLMAEIGQAGDAVPPRARPLVDSLSRLLVHSPTEYTTNLGAIGVPTIAVGFLQLGFPRAQYAVNSSALQLASGSTAWDKGPIPVPRVLRAANAWIWAARGQWDSALTLMTQLAAEHPGVLWHERYSFPLSPPVGGPLVALEAYGLAVIGAWVGASSPLRADRLRAAALAAVERLEVEENRRDALGRLLWLDGILGFARGDRRAIQVARRAAARSGYSQAELVERSLEGFELAFAGDLKRASALLAQLDEECLSRLSCNKFTPAIAVQRLATAEWLLQLGKLDEAVRVARWHDATEWWSFLYILNDVLRGPGYLVRARIEEARGNPLLAREYYQRFLARYDQPSPSQAQLITETRAALARLQTDQ